ncbi:MAG: peptide chain release factor N(5)-glutamine methyltransferase [Paludibacteraceae bacterium]|nr:peptide chain release factor N(5)-glutamine methyltransferase [Paludibacteraceae bacterium]
MSDIKYQISTIKSQLASAYPADEADALAWWIAEEVTGLSRTELQFGCKDTKNFAHTQEIIERLLRFEPIQYIFGHTLWYGLDLKVTPATLIPRPETAGLVEQISNLHTASADRSRPCRDKKSQISNAPIRVLDIGTGSGCIGIALKKAHPDWHVTGIDISPEAIAVARENALRNHADVNFLVADIFSDEIDKTFNSQLSTFNLIVSNPPYICESEKKDMRPNVLDYEPSTALFVPDSDPLLFYRRIASLFSNRPPVTLFFEINESYAAEVAAMMADSGYTGIRITKDIYGKDRIIEGRMAQ